MANKSDNLNKVDTISTDLATVFEKNCITLAATSEDQIGPVQSFVTDEGLKELATIFEAVPIELRAATYGAFLDKLMAKGLNYDINNLQGTVH